MNGKKDPAAVAPVPTLTAPSAPSPPTTRWRAFVSALLAAVMFWAGGVVLAGIDVSLDGEMQRLQELEALLRDLESARTDTDIAALTTRWEALREQFEQLGRVPDMPEDVRRKEIVNLNYALERLGSDLVTLREAVLFPKAANRVAVFTFDDPASLGVGDAISFLVSKHLLFSTRTRSFAVVNFQQGTAPDQRGGLAYFDKVDKLTAGQGYSVALWGRISATGDGAVVEMFGQAFPSLDPVRFAYPLVLPRAMGGEPIVASLSYDRFQLSTVALPADLLARLPEIATSVRTLRSSPSVHAAKSGFLTEDAPYYIAASEGDWVQLRVHGGAVGWTSVRAFCTGPCARLLPAVDFANEVVAAGAGQRPRAPAGGLDPDTHYVYRELAGLNALASSPNEALRMTDDYAKFGARGAGLGNIYFVARAAAALGPANADTYAERTLDTAQISSGLDTLESVLAYNPHANWPRRNLSTLLAYQGEPARQQRLAFVSARRPAVVIGNSNYERMPGLKYSQADAARMQTALQAHGYDVRLLLNATRATISSTIDAHQPVTIFFSGHALAEHDKIYLMGVDADPRQAMREGLALDEFTAPGRETTILLDAPLHERVPDSYRARFAELNLNLLLDVSRPDSGRVDIGTGAFAFLLSQSLGNDADDIDDDGFINLVELAQNMNRAAEAYALPLSANAIPANPARPPLVAAMR